MQPLPDMNEITNAMSGFQSYLKKAQGSAINEGLRQQLSQVEAQLQQAQSQFAAEYPKTLAKQKKDIEDILRQLTEERIFPSPVVTQVEPFNAFYPAEKYHQDYYSQNQDKPYCQIVINPKLDKFRKEFKKLLK